MKLSSKPKFKIIENEHIKIQFLETGDVFNILSDYSQINLLRGNILDGMVANIYMKLNNGFVTPLLGVKSPSTFDIINQKAYYTGSFFGIDYQVVCFLENQKWVYDVFYQSSIEQEITLYYGQDLAIQNLGSVLNSEAYTVQYIDYRVFEDNSGFTLLARQNQGTPQMCQIGCTGDTTSYSTDGFQFFGTEYKHTNQPIAFTKDHLVSEIYQYEFAYFALQTTPLKVKNSVQRISFYGYHQSSINGTRTTPFDVVIKQHSTMIKTNGSKIQGVLQDSQLINGQFLNRSELFNRYFEHREEEYEQGELLSFFTKNHHHVVLAQKELQVERPHGHLMIHGDIEHATENVMATTNFMFGVFHSHISLGNSTFHKFLGDNRNPLNIQKMAGLRIYVKKENTYQLLGLPSYYDMGATVTKWVYILENDEITITASVDINKAIQYLHIDSQNKHEFLVQMHILMNSEEFNGDVPFEVSDNNITFAPAENSMLSSHNPSLQYRLSCDTEIKLIPTEELLGTDDSQGFMFIGVEKCSEALFTISASYEEQPLPDEYDGTALDEKGTHFMKSWLKGFDFKTPHTGYYKLIDLAFWYTHNALVHYASPHGLEQFNGAAWGTRDVCQGPAELFLAADRYDLVREILIKVYRRQFIENGDFPQWYMFDQYYQIQAHDSHGDIIIWPLRLLGHYLLRTNDTSILNEEVEYMSIKENAFTSSKVTILDHVKKQFSTIKDSSIDGTVLPRYGGGDWDDTLQPANEQLKETMVSGWTVALLYETLLTFSKQIKHIDIEFASEIDSYQAKLFDDYQKYMLLDSYPVGFTLFNNPITYLIHPQDNYTNIHYRLLPYVRSIISRLSSHDESKNYDEIIDQYLKHPDGVRLMDKTVPYHGGENTLFQRAETAANFGREIGLQYVHAHIRYIEAMFSMNNPEKAIHGLLEICPINIQRVVENALTRQSNMYFSSSDAFVKTRYEAQEKFSLLKSGEVKVKGGWRLYSSGPGIYIRQLIEQMIGISRYQNKLLINPVSFETMEYEYVQYHFNKKKIQVIVKQGDSKVLVNNMPIKVETIKEPFGNFLYIIDPVCLNQTVNEIIIYQK